MFGQFNNLDVAARLAAGVRRMAPYGLSGTAKPRKRGEREQTFIGRCV